MANVLLLHSALGLRPSVLRDAERLRGAGHRVVAPDYLNGQVFDSVDDAMTFKAGIGRAALLARVEAVADDLSGTWVFAGYSLGAGLAQHLYEQREGAAGLYIANAVVPSRSHGVVQIHAAKNDPWIDQKAIVAAAASGAEVFWYQPGGHLFSDPGHPDYAPERGASSNGPGSCANPLPGGRQVSSAVGSRRALSCPPPPSSSSQVERHDRVRSGAWGTPPWTSFAEMMDRTPRRDVGRLSPLGHERINLLAAGRSGACVEGWIALQSSEFRAEVRVVAIDPSAPYAAGIRLALPEARIVLNHFPLVMFGNAMVTDVRQRAQREQQGR